MIPAPGLLESIFPMLIAAALIVLGIVVDDSEWLGILGVSWALIALWLFGPVAFISLGIVLGLILIVGLGVLLAGAVFEKN